MEEDKRKSVFLQDNQAVYFMEGPTAPKIPLSGVILRAGYGPECTAVPKDDVCKAFRKMEKAKKTGRK